MSGCRGQKGIVQQVVVHGTQNWSNFRLLWLVLEAASRTIFVHANISKSKTSF